MSEYISNSDPVTRDLTEVARAILTGRKAKENITLHRDIIDNVTPFQAMVVLDRLITEGASVAEVKAGTGKILNIFHRSLSAFEWKKPGEGHFIHYLMLENREVEKRIVKLRELTKRYFNGTGEDENHLLSGMLDVITDLKPYELHYLKKENILFPFIEKAFPAYRCLKIMWSFHDDFRQSLKSLREILSHPSPAKELLNREVGKLFFTVLPVIFREEQIVYPVALRALPEEAWQEMISQAAEEEWCYINPPVKGSGAGTAAGHIAGSTGVTGTGTFEPSAETDPGNRAFESSRGTDHGTRASESSAGTDLGTGSLTAAQITLMLDRLPVDITYVDENDEVRYFSGTKERIFPRSKAIIGRKVQNCHPPESVHVVEDILKAFRERRKDHADFWIEMRGRFIHIRYFALYDGGGAYRGTIEVSQDVTGIRELEGENRLLDWEEQD
jgi:DUF438 domain-containing protein